MSDHDNMTMHRNWIRRECFDLAFRMNRFSSVEKTIERAKEIEKYVFDQRPAEIVQLVGRDKDAKQN